MFYAKEAKAIETFGGAASAVFFRDIFDPSVAIGERFGLSHGGRTLFLKPQPLSALRLYMSSIGDLYFRVPK